MLEGSDQSKYLLLANNKIGSCFNYFPNTSLACRLQFEHYPVSEYRTNGAWTWLFQTIDIPDVDNIFQATSLTSLNTVGYFAEITRRG